MNTASPRPAHTVRFFAFFLLASSLALFVVSKMFEATHPIFPWLRALSEASMVGALADWFAVSALFRHPLGLPIPHTAIIPKNQSRIAGTLGRFVQENFLHPASLAPKLASARLGEKLATWLSDPAAARTIALQLKDLLRGFLEATSDKAVSAFIARAIPALSSQLKLGPLVAELVGAMRDGDKGGNMFNEILKLAEQLLQKHKEILEALVSKELPWYIPGFVKHHLYVQVAEAVRKTLTAMTLDRDHLLRQQLSHLVDKGLKELQQNPEWERRLQSTVSELCERGTVLEYLSNIRGVIVSKLKDSSQEDFSDGLVIALSFAARSVQQSPEISQRLNDLLALMVLRAVRDYGGHAGGFIEETMKGWDAKVLSEKIEAEVGRDLQFIRINGTVVGGLVGVSLHALVKLFESESMRSFLESQGIVF